MQNTQTSDVIRICGNGVPTVARLQRLPRDRLAARSDAGKLLPRPQGTYLIAGGLGALGLQVAAFLVAKGARRLILVSRRRLPPRQMWGVVEDEEVRFIVTKIQDLEAQGASVYPLSLDISAPNAALHLLDALERLAWPPVLGVVHAAGVLDNQLAMDTTQDAFSNVLAPKVDGGLALHEAFPPGSVDFFILFSSCGQLVGFTGQSSYGSANAFLDGLATYRRHLGDCAAVSFLWTSWRGMGMGASTKYIEAELESKGITDVTSREAFEAWEHLSKFDMDHGVVLRSLVFDQHEELPSSILNDIAIRRQEKATDEDGVANAASSQLVLPESPAKLKPFLVSKICGCVAQVLHMDAQEVDPRAALSDLGVDSVITVSLRRLLQQTLRVKVPPTLTWSHPTVDHLGGWFEEKLATMKI